MFGIFSAADGHFFLFAVVGFRATHLGLLMHAIKYSINAGASIAAHDYYTFIKAEFMPILLAKYILFYFMNKCDGLTEIKAGPNFADEFKVVKSLTIAVSQPETE